MVYKSYFALNKPLNKYCYATSSKAGSLGNYNGRIWSTVSKYYISLLIKKTRSVIVLNKSKFLPVIRGLYHGL